MTTFVERPALHLVPAERIESRVLLIRGEKVLIDSHLAELYGVTTKALNQAVRRNEERFPADFMIRLSASEADILLRSQIVTSKRTGSGGRRYLPHAFTEQGVAMLSSVLRSPRAIAVNIEIMRAFVRLRRMITSNVDLARKLATLEQKYDRQFKIVFDAIRELMTLPAPAKKGEIGFHTLIKPVKETLGAPRRSNHKSKT